MRVSFPKIIKQIIALALFIILFAWVSLSVKQNRTFPIKNVQVVSSFKHLDQKTIKGTIQPFAENGFFGIQATMLNNQLMQLPWVKSVSIQRVWPDRIIITIEEQKAIAEWNKISLVNQEGQLFTPDKNTFPDNLPKLYGPGSNIKEILENYFAINQTLQPLQYYISELNVDSHRIWRIILNNQITMIIGTEGIIGRIKTFTKAFPKIAKTPNKTPAIIDLRYKNGFTIKWNTIPDAIPVENPQN